MDNIATAIAFAASFHENQIDKSGKPYVLHPIHVMMAMERDGFNEDVLCVAVLHDTVEDTELTLEMLELNGFQPQVVAGVDAMTRRENETYKAYINRCLANDIASAVKYYDSRHNISRRDGLDKDFIKFLDKRYGGTIAKIDSLLAEHPNLWDHLKG